MSKFLKLLMADQANLPVSELCRHAKTWVPAKDNAKETSILSYPQVVPQKLEALRQELMAAKVDFKIETVIDPAGKVAALMRVPFPHADVDAAIQQIRKTQPVKVVRSGVDHLPPDQRPNRQIASRGA